MVAGAKLGILENIQSRKGGFLQGAQSGNGPLGLGIIPNIQQRINSIMKR